MADFFLSFDRRLHRDSAWAAGTRLGALHQEIFGSAASEAHAFHGAALILFRSGAEPLHLHTESRGFAVLKGFLFDPQKNDDISLREVFEDYLTHGPEILDRMEGAFDLAMWDETTQKGLVANDQAATFNLYYGNVDGAFVAGSSPLFLAKALGLGLDADSVREFLGRGALIAPSSMYRGLKRLNLGEIAVVENGRERLRRNWIPYAEPLNLRYDEAAERLAETASALVGRYGRMSPPVLSDLTSGYDSRMVVAACAHAGIDFGVTVNGDPDHVEVRIAKKIAYLAGLPMVHTVPREIWTEPVTPELRREFVYRTGGELRFSEAYHQWLTRPRLAEHYRLHFTGGGNDTTRYYPWAQEFFGIGRRRRANIRNLLRYRFLYSAPPEGLYARSWFPHFVNRLHERIEEVCAMGGNTLTTQQLDAVHIWKMTGHFSPYSSALSGWLTTLPPLNAKSYLETSISFPWQLKLTAHLARKAHVLLSPVIAEVETQYGGTGAPVRLGTLHREMLQTVMRGAHLAEKLEHVVLKGALSKRLPRREAPPARVPYATGEFMAFMNPDSLYCRRLFNRERLDMFLEGSLNKPFPDETLVQRLATLEQVCRELDIQPEADFL